MQAEKQQEAVGLTPACSSLVLRFWRFLAWRVNARLLARSSARRRFNASDPEGGWRPERCEEPGTESVSWRREDVVWSRRGSRWP